LRGSDSDLTSNDHFKDPQKKENLVLKFHSGLDSSTLFITDYHYLAQLNDIPKELV
jgi:hypothetical protein